MAADQACCACGAGSYSPCSASSSAAACEPTDAAQMYPRHQCVWDQSSCRGTGSGFFISPGEFSPPWRAFSQSQQGNKVVAVFQWTPLRGMEGQTHQICMRGSHVGNSSGLAEVCAFLRVMKCYYCTRVGETLNYVAEQYNFDTNWLRLWNFNPDIQDPDLILRNYLPIVIGSTYKVQLGDTLSRVAARLRTTVKKILEVNPDMTSTDLFIDQEICVMPCTENPYAGAPLNPYIPQSIFGLSSSFVEQIPRISRDPRFP
uniref:LysM domain-containing protein n=1 Tax=Hanusia phi TaxID=3032 RepID=A0A7S0NF34_9CRYP